MITRPSTRRNSLPSISSIQTYLTYLTVGIITTSVIGGLVIGGAWANIYFSLIPAKQDGLPDLFNGTITFPAILGLTLNQKGIVQGVIEGIVEGPNGTMLDPVITYDVSNFPNAAQATAFGDSLQINISSGLALFGLVDRGVEGTYVNPIVTYTNEGVAVTVANGSVPTASDIIYQNETVADALENIQTALDTSELLSYGPTASPNAKQLVAQGPSFFLNTTGPVAIAGLLPRGVAGTYVNPVVTYEDDGIASAVANGPPITAADVLYFNSTVQATIDDILQGIQTSELLAYGPTDFPLSKQLVAQGPSFFIDATGPNVVAGLLPRGVAGTYVRPTVTYAGDGIATAVANGPPLQAFEIEFGLSNVETALLSNILVSQFSPALNNSQVFTPNFDAFIFSSGNGTFSLTLRPRPMIGMTCTHPTQITYDMQFGLPESCTSGPAPGTPTGAATLDGSGKIIASQLPDFLFALRLVGLWNAATNVPFLTNASCPGDATFYYLVSDSGNTSLGHNDIWFEGDKALCLNGTWDRVSRPQMTFNGRSNDVVPELGDYDASLIGFGNATLDALLGYGFVMWTSSPALPGGQILQGIAGQTVVSGTVVGLAPKANFPSPINVFAGFISYIEIDHFGRVETLSLGNPVVSIIGTPNQISASPGPNVTLSLEQDIDVNADVVFNSATLNSLVLGTKTITALGGGNVTFPNVGSADVVMTEGNQQIGGSKQFTQSIVIRNGAGLTLWDAANLFNTLVAPSNALSSNTLFPLPGTNGVDGDVLVRSGASSTVWSGTVVKTITGTPNRVIIGGTPQNPTATTPQDLHIAANVQFASMQVSTFVLNGRSILAPGTGTITFPSGTGDVVMTTGAQNVGGTKSFSSTPVILGGGGVRLNNPANTFSTLVRANTALSANTNFNTPLTNGVPGQVLTALGGGDTQWAAVPGSIKDYQNVVVTTTTTRTVNTFALLDSMTITTTNTANEVYRVDFKAVGSTTTNNIPVEFRLLLNGTPVTNQIARFSQFANEDWTAVLSGRLGVVPPASTITIEWRVVIPPGSTTASVRYRTFEVLQI